MDEDIKQMVLAELKRVFPAFPVAVQASPEDSAALWVRVFAVPTDQVRAVKDCIHDLEDKLPADSEAMLLPMVKTMEVTRQYYRDYMPLESMVPVAAFIDQYRLETVQQVRTWETAPCGHVRAKDYRPITPQDGFGMSAGMHGPLRPRRTEETGLATDTQLALAA